MIDDSTSWVIHPLWRNANNNEWYGQGRQGLVNQVTYDTSGKPTADYPINIPKTAPKLPSSGIPWMVPHSDFFTSDKLNPEWSFLGYTPDNTYSLTDRPGWLHLSPKGKINTVIKNDGEHNYSTHYSSGLRSQKHLMIKLEFGYLTDCKHSMLNYTELLIAREIKW